MSAVVPKVNGRPVAVPTSSGPRSLAEAVLAVQAAAPKLRRNEPGQVGSRTYMYTTIAAVKEDIGPLLTENGLLWRARPTDNERGEPALRYTMTHVPSGEEDTDVVTLKGVSDSQSFGSAISYMRRYALVAYLDLVSEDDDGAAASQGDSRNGSNLNQSLNQTQPTAAPPKQSERQLTEAQQRLLRARFGEANLDVITCANIVAVAKGEPVRENADEDAAKRWLDREIDRLPARLVDKVLEGIAACPPY